MPQRRQPKTLFDLSIVHVAQAVFKVCLKIEAFCGDYDQQETKHETEVLQRNLLEAIPCTLFDKLYERRSQILEYDLKDHKILLAVYLHRNVRALISLTASLRYLVDSDNFWLERLPRLQNLVELDFKLMCTDEILKVVGENCSKLEYMNCISKMSTINRSSQNNLNFNALRVELFVSDEGLSCLSRCRKLKKITMNRKINSQCAGKKPTIEGIRALVKSLPLLQCLTFEDLGSVVSSGMEDCPPLSLIQLSDTHPTPQHMFEIAKMCPDLKELFLVKPINLDNNENISLVDVHFSHDILSALAQTDIQLDLLGMEHFPFDESFINFLTVKGSGLTSLQLYSRYDHITSQELLVIGETCPNLIGLHLHGLSIEKAQKNYTFPQKSKFFRFLNCISLGGNNWDPCLIVPMCIVNSQSLARMSLFNKGCELTLDDVFTELMLHHKFEKLRVLHLHEGCFISFETLRTFVYHCPCLTVVKITPKGFTREDVDVLIKELYVNNYDIIVDVY